MIIFKNGSAVACNDATIFVMLNIPYNADCRQLPFPISRWKYGRIKKCCDESAVLFNVITSKYCHVTDLKIETHPISYDKFMEAPFNDFT